MAFHFLVDQTVYDTPYFLPISQAISGSMMASSAVGYTQQPSVALWPVKDKHCTRRIRDEEPGHQCIPRWMDTWGILATRRCVRLRRKVCGYRSAMVVSFSTVRYCEGVLVFHSRLRCLPPCPSPESRSLT